MLRVVCQSLLRSSSTMGRCNGRRLLSATQPHQDVLFSDEVITNEEATSLLSDIDRKLGTKRYQGSHFDSVIQDYRETEMPLQIWSEANRKIIERLFKLALSLSGLPETTPTLPPHVIDLKAKTGAIYPHVDSLKHGGAIVAALSLISTRTLRLTVPPMDFIVGARLDLEGKPTAADYVLGPRTFYVLTKSARYDLAHEILPGEQRRVSIVFRDQPKDYIPDWAKDFSMGSGKKL